MIDTVHCTTRIFAMVINIKGHEKQPTPTKRRQRYSSAPLTFEKIQRIHKQSYFSKKYRTTVVVIPVLVVVLVYSTHTHKHYRHHLPITHHYYCTPGLRCTSSLLILLCAVSSVAVIVIGTNRSKWRNSIRIYQRCTNGYVSFPM